MSDLGVDKGPAVLTSVWAVSATACVFVIARLLVRLGILKKAGWDDGLITFSMMISFIYAAIITVAVQSGYGRHADTLTGAQFIRAKKFNLASFIPGLLAIVVPKLAVVALLVRTMNPSRRQQAILWGSAGGSGLLLMGCVVILYAQCRPVTVLWTPISEIESGNVHCWSPSILVNYSIVVGAIAAAVDAYLAIYPAVIIWKLHMSIKKKIGLSLALGLGAGACIMAIVKCTRLPTLYDSKDATYATADLFIWTSIESNSIIIAACVPTIAPLIELTVGRRILSTDKYSNTGRTGQTPNRGYGNGYGHNSRAAQDKSQMHQDDSTKNGSTGTGGTANRKAKAWLSAINVERSYHQCSIQRGSDDELRGLDPSPTMLDIEEGYGIAMQSGIQRRDDVIIEYGKWPASGAPSMVEEEHELDLEHAVPERKTST